VEYERPLTVATVGGLVEVLDRQFLVETLRS
jgi:hypothetical protein